MRAMAKRVQVTVFDPNDCRVELFSREYGAARATSLAARGRRGRQISEVLADAVSGYLSIHLDRSIDRSIDRSRERRRTRFARRTWCCSRASARAALRGV